MRRACIARNLPNQQLVHLAMVDKEYVGEYMVMCQKRILEAVLVLRNSVAAYRDPNWPRGLDGELATDIRE